MDLPVLVQIGGITLPSKGWDDFLAIRQVAVFDKELNLVIRSRLLALNWPLSIERLHWTKKNE